MDLTRKVRGAYLCAVFVRSSFFLGRPIGPGGLLGFLWTEGPSLGRSTVLPGEAESRVCGCALALAPGGWWWAMPT